MTKKNILLVDDNPMYLRVLTKRFLEQNYEITEASSAREALQCIAHTKFDAIISDVSLPDFSGISLATEVKKTGVDIPFIFISAYPIHEMIAEDSQLVLDHNFFPKPFNFELLLEKVYALVHNHPSIEN